MRPSLAPQSRRFAISGALLLLGAGVGFLTVADELRHLGEFFGVLAVLLCGLSLLLAGLRPELSGVLALQWAPVGIVIGALAGAVVDRVVLGVLGGCLLGLLLARVRRARAA